ncbi:hypothetical protein D3C87_1448110 [compost metagenome]
MEIHGRVPTVDGSGLKADVNLRYGKLVRCDHDTVAKVRSAVKVIRDGERFEVVSVRVHETRFELLGAHVNSDKKLQGKFLLSFRDSGNGRSGMPPAHAPNLTLAYENTLRSMSCPGSAKARHGLPKGTASG